MTIGELTSLDGVLLITIGSIFSWSAATGS
jgi:uncharacterized membrane protein YcaP (DUF421 family)